MHLQKIPGLFREEEGLNMHYFPFGHVIHVYRVSIFWYWGTCAILGEADIQSVFEAFGAVVWCKLAPNPQVSFFFFSFSFLFFGRVGQKSSVCNDILIV